MPHGGGLVGGLGGWPGNLPLRVSRPALTSTQQTLWKRDASGRADAPAQRPKRDLCCGGTPGASTRVTKCRRRNACTRAAQKTEQAGMQRKTKVQLLAVVGLLISSYALSVEKHLDDDDYEAMCDISAKVSCTAVFQVSVHLRARWVHSQMY